MLIYAHNICIYNKRGYFNKYTIRKRMFLVVFACSGGLRLPD